MNEVREFHERMGLPVDREIDPDLDVMWFDWVGLMMETMGSKWRDDEGNLELQRMGLILEELGELAQAFATGNRVKVLDALADLKYVVEGAAVTYGLPLDAAFAEVHRSNMTKTPPGDGSNVLPASNRGKGPSYSPPDLQQVLDAHS